VRLAPDKMIIRDAELSDIPTIVILGREMQQESRFRKFDFDPVKLSDRLSYFINNDAGNLLRR